MRRHRVRIITLLALLALTSACDDSAQEPTPPPPDEGLSVNVINPQPKVVTMVVPLGNVGKSEIPEAKIFSATITNDQIPAELKDQMTPVSAEEKPDGVVTEETEKGSTAKLSLTVPSPTKEEPTPKPELDNPSETSPIPAKTIDATGAYRVEAAFGLQRSLPSGYSLTAITPHQEHVVRGGGLSSMKASRMVVLAPGKKLADGIAVLKNRKMSANKTEYSDGAVLFYEQTTAKEAGKWKLRNLAGEETVLDLGAVAVEPISQSKEAKEEEVQQGYFLLKFAAEPASGYLLIKSADKSVLTVCAKGCVDAVLVRHPTDGVFIVYRDMNDATHPAYLASADLQKKWTLGTDPDLAEGDTQKIGYHSTSFLPTGEFTFARTVVKSAKGDTMSIATTSKLLLNLQDSNQRVIAEYATPTKEAVLQAPLVQREAMKVLAVVGDRTLVQMRDVMWSLTGVDNMPSEPVAYYLTWIAADGTRTDIFSSETTVTPLKYWPETNRIALQVDDAMPIIKILKADSGQEETAIKKAVAVPYVDGGEFWPFAIFDNRDGLTDTEHKFEIIGPYLDRVELGTVEGSNISIRLTDLATDAAPTRVADETAVPNLTIEVQPAEVNVGSVNEKATVQIIAATPFDSITGLVKCDGAEVQKEMLPWGSSEVVQPLEVMLSGEKDATCTVTADDGLKKATATFVVKYMKKEEPPPPPPPAAVTIEQHPVKWTAPGQMWAVIPSWNNQFVRASMDQATVKAPWVVVKGSAQKPTFTCEGLPPMFTNNVGKEVNCAVADAVCWSAGIQWTKVGFPTDGKAYKCAFQVGGATLDITMTNTVK